MTQEHERDAKDGDRIDPTIAERFDEPAREVADANGPQPVDEATPTIDEAVEGPAPEETAEVDDERSREELLAALAAVERERDEYLDALKRQQAEFQNYRKRAMREGTAERQKGETDVLVKLIEVVDDFELAVLAVGQAARGGSQPGQSAKDVDSLRKGVEMVYGKLIDVLKGFGLEKIGQEGVPFDPVLHEAVQHEHDDEDRDQPVVAEVMRYGYMVGDRVLRPAMVKVVD